jgi:hypothetical protein
MRISASINWSSERDVDYRVGYGDARDGSAKKGNMFLSKMTSREI